MWAEPTGPLCLLLFGLSGAAGGPEAAEKEELGRRCVAGADLERPTVSG